MNVPRSFLYPAWWDTYRQHENILLPQFPEFKCLAWCDKKDVEQLTADFPPYSDFNFTSLYVWDVENKMRISELNGNLIVLFSDYISNTPFLSFIGSNKISETARILLEYSKEHFSEPSLMLIPETVATSLCTLEFAISPDRDAFDYIFSTADLSNMHLMSSNQNEGARLLRLFNNAYRDHICECFPLRESHNGSLLQLYLQWAKNKNINHLATNEYMAFERMLQCGNENIQVVLLHINGALKGFSVFETLSRDYALAHFCKADISNKGIYEALLWQTGKHLFRNNVQYYNFEQDLGILNLRKAKGKYKNHSFLKKFTVYKNE